MRNVLIALTVLTLLSVWFVNPSLAQTPAPTAMATVTEMEPTATAMAVTTAMPAATEVAAAECMSDYTVKAGDRLYRVASTEYGITTPYRSLVAAVTGIVDATNAKSATDKTYATIADQGTIRVGWKLCIPKFEPAAAGVAMTPAAMTPAGMTPAVTSTTATTPAAAMTPATMTPAAMSTPMAAQPSPTP